MNELENWDTTSFSPAAKLMQWSFKEARLPSREICAEFCPPVSMANPHGNVQGGFVAAMLDETMGAALLIISGGEYVASTIDMTVSFMRPVKVGPLRAVGRVEKLGRKLAFLEATLLNGSGEVLAKATSTALPIKRSQ